MHAQDPNAEINVARTFHKKEDEDEDEDEAKTKNNNTLNGRVKDEANDDEETAAKAEGDEIEKGEIVKGKNCFFLFHFIVFYLLNRNK